MKKKNGFTMVELLVSLVLITTLSLALFKTVANIQKKEQMSIARNSLTAFKTVLNSNIENDFVDDIITDIYSCGDNCFDITYKNSDKEYSDSFNINLSSYTDLIQPKAATDNKELKIISYALQDLVEKQL